MSSRAGAVTSTPQLGGFRRRPIDTFRDLSAIPGFVYDLLSNAQVLRAARKRPRARRAPTLDPCSSAYAPLDSVAMAREFPSRSPTCRRLSARTLERYLRATSSARHSTIPRPLPHRGSSCRRAITRHGRARRLGPTKTRRALSEAVQDDSLPCSTSRAHPRVDYVDAACAHANIDARSSRADLVICYNPFRAVLQPVTATSSRYGTYRHVDRSPTMACSRAEPGVPHAAALPAIRHPAVRTNRTSRDIILIERPDRPHVLRIRRSPVGGRRAGAHATAGHL